MSWLAKSGPATLNSLEKLLPIWPLPSTLLALCRLRRRFPHDLDAIRFGLWYKRYSLPIDDVKRSMERLLNPLLRTLPLNTSDSLTASEQLASQAQSKPLRSSSGRRLKRLNNTGEVDTVLSAIFQLMLGDVPGFTAHVEEELGERSLTELFIDVLKAYPKTGERVVR